MPAPGETLRIDGARLWDSIMEMARIGPGVAGGNNRQTLTDADAEGRALFRRWCEAAGNKRHGIIKPFGFSAQ
jgi:N-carbamoyl-L-amino-acid hydrolase